jgi:hypothetical protein
MVTVIANQKRTTAVDGDAIPCTFSPIGYGTARLWIQNQPCVPGWVNIRVGKDLLPPFGFISNVSALTYIVDGVTKTLAAPVKGGTSTSSEGIEYSWDGNTIDSETWDYDEQEEVWYVWDGTEWHPLPKSMRVRTIAQVWKEKITYLSGSFQINFQSSWVFSLISHGHNSKTDSIIRAQVGTHDIQTSSGRLDWAWELGEDGAPSATLTRTAI